VRKINGSVLGIGGAGELTWRSRDVNTFTIEKTLGTMSSDGKIACAMTHINRMHNRIYYASTGHYTEGYELFANSV
jgi:hypothetical protein